MTEQGKKFPEKIFVQEAFEQAMQQTRFSVVATGDDVAPFVNKHKQTVAIYRLVEVAEIVVSVDFKPREDDNA